MIDPHGQPVTVEQVIATVKAQQSGVQVRRQAHDAPIDVLRQTLRREASLKRIEVTVDHVDDNVLLIIPAVRVPTLSDVHAAMDIPTGF
ncbi:hypothetical protein ABIB25_001060 [Nakamurella sp. UYEF19]|uniref:hypothetical protein n=1 Tax=Nakamurella sp. UYEF19 TaxID=1756392 RepID=UPI00339ACDCC